MGDHAVNRFVEEVTVEPDAIARAREAALELGAEPISAAVGVQCATIAAVGRALNIVEIGTGGGVSGLWLLRGAPLLAKHHHHAEECRPQYGVDQAVSKYQQTAR